MDLHLEEQRDRAIWKLTLACAVLAAVGILLTSCTVAPPVVHPKTVNYVGNSENGGVISLGPGNKGPAVVTQEWVKAYAVLAKKYGKDLTPPVKPGDGVLPQPNGTFTVDLEHLSDANVMATLQRSGIAP